MQKESETQKTKVLLQELSGKLDIVVALLLRSIPKEMESLSFKDQVRFLESLNIRPVDISRITGRTQSYVNKELVSIRKEK